MHKRFFKIVMVLIGIIVILLVVGVVLVCCGTINSPIAQVWFYVNGEDGSTSLPDAKVYVDGRFVGVTAAGGESFRQLFWRHKTYKIKVAKQGYLDYTQDIRPDRLRLIQKEDGPVGGPFELDIRLLRQQATRSK